MQRTKSSIKNLAFAFGGQFIGILINLVARLVFVRILATEYLGLNGLFTNILSMLSLIELGIGPAMTYSLYKPLAEGNKEKVKSLMQLYKKAYIIIGILMLIIGISLIPVLPFFIGETPTSINESINLIYILFVINTAISYFFSYKRSLIISDQKRYIATVYRYGFYFVLNIAQIIMLILTKNYIVYLLLQILFTFAENLAISKKANKMYPYLKEKDIKELENSDKTVIKKNVTAMVAHKIGGIVVNSTDNIIISKFVGLIQVGIYSNYLLITTALTTIIGHIFVSVTASVGNLYVTESKEKVEKVFQKIFFLNFWIYGFTSICLFIIFNNFIEIWLGKEYLFESIVVLFIILNFFVSGMRKSVLTFKEALGIYWQDRYKPLVEAVTNIILSIILVKQFGIIGVFLGTIITTLLICVFVETYVLYKYGFETKIKKYFIKYFKYIVLTVIACVATYMVSKIVIINNIYINFIYKIVVCILMPNIIFFIFTYKTEEFKYFKDLIKNILIKIFKKKIKR